MIGADERCAWARWFKRMRIWARWLGWIDVVHRHNVRGFASEVEYQEQVCQLPMQLVVPEMQSRAFCLGRMCVV